MFFYLCGTHILSGQIAKDTTALSEIILEGSPIKNILQNTASSVSVISSANLNKTDGIALTPVLNKVPGVFMQLGNLNTSRISIRGIGARTQYGTNRIKAYYNSIPLSSGEGEIVIEDIDINAIEKIEIIKGPNSTSFGSGLGGAIHLFARKTPLFESFGKVTSNFGSFGLLQQRISSGYSDLNSNLFISYMDFQNDGFRTNSAYNRKSFNINGNQKIGKNGYLSLLGIFTRLKAFIPSSLNENDYNNRPENAAANWAAAQGYESYNKLMIGLGYDYQFSKNLSLKSSFFSNAKHGYETRPFDILEDKTNLLGLRLHFNYKSLLLNLPFELSLGTELAKEKYQYSLFENLYLLQLGQGSLQGAKFNTMQQKRNFNNYFLQMEVWLSKNLHLETGIAANSTKYSLEDVFQTNSDIKNSDYTFGNIWSPRIGFSYSLGKGKNIYTSVSKGFSVPSVAETLSPNGKINTDLRPEIGWNYEIGLKGNWFKNKLYTELAFFSTQIENLLVARRTAEDQYVGINAGSSSHPGIEFLVNYKLLETLSLQITPYFSTTFNNFKFKNFVDAEADYSGNELTGVANKKWNFGLDINTKKGFSINISHLTVGKIPLNDSNSKYSKEYSLLDIKSSFLFTVLKVLRTELSAGINNALNEKYAASILPNAVGFGASSPRYYYPGSPINYYGGFSVNYVF